MLSERDISFYREQGYIFVPDVLTAEEVATLRAVTDRVVSQAGGVSENNAVYDLESTHRPDAPRVRRIKEPHKVDPFYKQLAFHKKIASIIGPLLGPSGVRYQTGKLNMKSAEYGAPVEWHQDWAFYPHTNDDLLAIGILLDDCAMENGPLMVVPGSHKGPIFDHHANGYFCGAIDPTTCPVDFSKAAALTGKAGGMTVHHVRAVHGSSLNTSNRQRRLLLFQYTAVDAWPLIQVPSSIEEYDANIVLGRPVHMPRLTSVPVRLPLPPAPHQGSIYENQRSTAHRYFETFEDKAAKKAAKVA
jgi:phytanoyl-CoA hydroxylase